MSLPREAEFRLKKVVSENHMLYEMWIETSFSYKDLRESLVSRGYKCNMNYSPAVPKVGQPEKPIVGQKPKKVMMQKKA